MIKNTKSKVKITELKKKKKKSDYILTDKRSTHLTHLS